MRSRTANIASGLSTLQVKGLTATQIGALSGRVDSTPVLTSAQLNALSSSTQIKSLSTHQPRGRLEHHPAVNGRRPRTDTRRAWPDTFSSMRIEHAQRRAA